MTDKVSMETQDPLLTETAEILGDQAADTFDQLTPDVLTAGTSVFYANGVGRRASVAANVSETDYRKIAHALRKNKTRKLTKMVTGTDQVGTIKAAFVDIINPDTYRA
jgi:N4-gp56 family major capsid protein